MYVRCETEEVMKKGRQECEKKGEKDRSEKTGASGEEGEGYGDSARARMLGEGAIAVVKNGSYEGRTRRFE